MLKETFVEIFERDIRKLIDEVILYKSEQNLWKIESAIHNSAGNLCLHLIGNLNHFIGAVIGKTGYIRNRDNEFILKGIKREQIIADLESTIETIKTSFDKLSEKDFEKEFPAEKQGKIVSIAYMMLHLLTHFNYHLGQINYHRRLLDQV
jgi:hypothetical protein